MDRIDIKSSGLVFKNLLSGPAPAGRILNYIKLAGTSGLYHQDGYRSTDLKDQIGCAWATEFMIGLNIFELGNEVQNKRKLLLTPNGQRLFSLINNGKDIVFNEGSDDSSIRTVRDQMDACSSNLSTEYMRTFVSSVPFRILKQFLDENGYRYNDRALFMDDLFEAVKNLYDPDPTPYNRNAKTTTGYNRVPSILQLCKLFYMLDEINNGLRFHKNIIELLMNPNDIDTGDISPEDKPDEKGKAENILLYGVPGAGKSYYIKTQFKTDDYHMERVVFHPEYSFSDFVGQILPKAENNSIKYLFTPGPFTNILRKAVEAEQTGDNKPFYLIIEEINRGNAPAIFGDLFQLLDRSETGESEYGITNYDIANEVYKDGTRKVRIPSNLWIIATMNTSDQNVFTLDTAFQRRWNMKLIKNDIAAAKHARTNIEHSSVFWGDFAVEINKTILEANESVGSFGDKRLGAYFAKEDELDVEHFSGKVLKYLWDDAFKMNHDMVFAGNINSLELLIETYKNAAGDPLAAILKQEIYNRMNKQLPSASSIDNDTDPEETQ